MTLAGAVLLLALTTHVGNLFRRLGRTELLGWVQFEYWLVLIGCFVNLTNSELAAKTWVLRAEFRPSRFSWALPCCRDYVQQLGIIPTCAHLPRSYPKTRSEPRP
jgi:hypothetical protein